MANANFYIPNDNGYKLLEYKKYYKNQGTSRYIIENKRYAAQLTLYMNDCSEVKDAIARTDYTEQSMIQLFNRYFEKCGGGESVFHKEPEKIRGEFGILAGATFTRFNIEYAAKGVEYLYYLDNQASIDFTAAVFYDFIFPEYNGRWSINSELAFVSLSTSGEYDDIRSDNIKTNYSTELEYDYLTFRCMARYHYPVGKAKLFISAGLFNGFLLNDNSQTTVTDTTYSLVIVNTQSPFQTKSTEQGMLLGLGLRIGKWKMETRYEIGNGTSDTSAVSTNTSKVLLQTGFSF
ncbi:MAG: outer membrane beta-barrel protein [Cyclobacteriaceae bacterium]|nr:outer membrane beta-barrel protein [Cyclobacteriaceae bacterium]